MTDSSSFVQDLSRFKTERPRNPLGPRSRSMEALSLSPSPHPSSKTVLPKANVNEVYVEGVTFPCPKTKSTKALTGLQSRSMAAYQTN